MKWNTYYILYYEINDEWIIIIGDYNNINTNNIIAHIRIKQCHQKQLLLLLD